MDYKKIFKPETLTKLDKQSAESLKQMLGNKTLLQTMISSQNLIDKITEAEAPYISKLERLAVQIVEELYPIIEQEDIIIDAKIIPLGQVQLPQQGKEEEEEEEEKQIEQIPLESRRRIINAVTQGAAIRGAFAFYLFKENLDKLDKSLVDNYNEILKNSFGIYDDDNAIAMMLALLAQNKKIAGGSSEVEFEEEEESPFIIIKARAINFPMLVHEIVKGLFEIVSLQGFKGDKQQNQQVVDKVDTLSNEPYDLKYGKFIYDALRNVGYKNGADNKIIPYFFSEVYKLDNEPFVDFIEKAIMDELNNQQINWVKNTIKDIQTDLNYDKMGIDEIKVAEPLSAQKVIHLYNNNKTKLSKNNLFRKHLFHLSHKYPESRKKTLDINKLISILSQEDLRKLYYNIIIVIGGGSLQNNYI